MADSNQPNKKGVWFQLVDKNKQPFQGTCTDRVFVSPGADVVDFRKAVHNEYATSKLKEIDAADLKVFKNRAAFYANEPVDEDAPIEAYGPTKGSALLVLVAPFALVSPNQYLDFSPPPILFVSDHERKKITKSSARAHPRHPKQVTHWSEFIGAARSFKLNELKHNIGLLSPPSFTHNFYKCNCEQLVQCCLHTNFVTPMEHLLRHIQSSFDLVPPAGMKLPLGIPDVILAKKGQDSIFSFLELKTIWDLATPSNTESLIGWWDEDADYHNNELARDRPLDRPDIYRVIQQVYGYLSQYRLRYGMLSNGECVWFLHRPALGELQISDPIPFNGDDPTIFRAFVFFSTLVEEEPYTQKFPPSSPESEDSPLNPIRHGPPVHGYETRTKKLFLENIMKKNPKYPEDLDLDNIDFENTIGEGASGGVIAHTSKHGTRFAVKCCDIQNNPYGYEMMKNEVQIYSHLEEIQGNVIPKLYWAGLVGEIFYMAMESLPGKSPKIVPTEIQRNFIHDLAKYNVDHGDIRASNFIWDEKSNRYWIIDFGKSRIVSSSSSSSKKRRLA